MLELQAKNEKNVSRRPAGQFLPLDGERSYAIRDVDLLPPFFMSIISSADHWLFVSSTGGLTAGRNSPETALFPYVPVDQIHGSTTHTGCKTIIRVNSNRQQLLWEPFNKAHDDRFDVSRNLYKTIAGDKLCFEEINHDLQLAFRYTWMTSDEFGFSRQCEMKNLGDRRVRLELLDGLQNILPAGTPQATQAAASNLVDAYKWSELDQATGLAIYSLYSAISDRAEPAESLRANTVFCIGLEQPTILLSAAQLDAFRTGLPLTAEAHRRGVRGVYFVNASLELGPKGNTQWRLVANVEQSQASVVALRRNLGDPEDVQAQLNDSIARGSRELAQIMAATDALQLTAEENVVAHHYANVLFNNLRGGIIDDQGHITTQDFARSVRHFNRRVFAAHQPFLEQLPDRIDFGSLLTAVLEQGDPDLERLCYEYLPVRFGRRHGDPSRPWNRFSILSLIHI